MRVVGAALVYFLGDGPHGAAIAPRAGSAAPRDFAVREVFAIAGFRASAFGYFGHMWELYAFWSVLPWLCAPIAAELARQHGATSAPSVAFMSFAVIAIGSIGCIAGGQWSRRIGSARVAALALAGSGLMCLVYPLIPAQATALRIAALLFWGLCVVADSPQFSALSARFAPPQWLGSALVLQNGIGFLITVASIVIMSRALPAWGASAMWILAPGAAARSVGDAAVADAGQGAAAPRRAAEGVAPQAAPRAASELGDGRVERRQLRRAPRRRGRGIGLEVVLAEGAEVDRRPAGEASSHSSKSSSASSTGVRFSVGSPLSLTRRSKRASSGCRSQLIVSIAKLTMALPFSSTQRSQTPAMLSGERSTRRMRQRSARFEPSA